MLPARRLPLFSAAILAALAAALAVLLPAGTPSAASRPAAGNRVWAFSLAASVHAGADRLVSPGQRLGDPAACPFCASGSCAAPEDAAAANTAERLAASCGGASFTADTKVLLASGIAVPIASLKPGDKVLATNVRTGKARAEPVAAVLVHHDANRYDLRLKTARGTAVVHTISNHLFWDQDTRRWVKAGALKYGTRLRTPGSASVTVLGGNDPQDNTGWMWDLSVPGGNDHDFYIDVVNTGILVHNCPVPRDNGYLWPKNNGFEGPSVKTSLPEGYQFDRYGGIPATDTGRFASPAGTPFEMRSLPASSLKAFDDLRSHFSVRG